MRVYFMDAGADTGRDIFIVSEGMQLEAFLAMLRNVEGVVPGSFQQVLVLRPAKDVPLEEGDFVLFLDKDQPSEDEDLDDRSPTYDDNARGAMDARLMEAAQRSADEDRKVNAEWESASPPIDDEPTGHV